MNRQPLRRARDLLGVLRVTVFSPDDLEIVKQARQPAGPARPGARGVPAPQRSAAAPTSTRCCASATPCSSSRAVG
ncbi:MAG: hypothetical protein R2699_01485 [Acidimicrobiales bacterium]